MNTTSRLLLALAAGLTVGCGSDLAEVTGTVSLDGGPLDSGTIVFQGPDLPQGVGQIGEDGSYRISTGTQRGLPPGQYRVTVTAYKTRTGRDEQEAPIPEFLTPVRYNNPETSGLTADVEPGGNRFDFTLEP
ncbi:MAG: hypothetical protein HQ581_10155 [Planctomycetes bacterium]|nr:hypothetical protein [Planctomycetota bacterium]